MEHGGSGRNEATRNKVEPSFTISQGPDYIAFTFTVWIKGIYDHGSTSLVGSELTHPHSFHNGIETQAARPMSWFILPSFLSVDIIIGTYQEPNVMGSNSLSYRHLGIRPLAKTTQKRHNKNSKIANPFCLWCSAK